MYSLVNILWALRTLGSPTKGSLVRGGGLRLSPMVNEASGKVSNLHSPRLVRGASYLVNFNHAEDRSSAIGQYAADVLLERCCGYVAHADRNRFDPFRGRVVVALALQARFGPSAGRYCR